MSKKWGKIYLDKENAWISGVCAGLAHYMQWNVKWVRLGWFFGLLFWTPIFLLSYVALAFFLDPMPEDPLALDEDLRVLEEAAKPARPGSVRRKFASARDRYVHLEDRLRALESVVTSKAFQMDRELKRQ